MRPGCDRPATARLTYDPVACDLWLDPLGPTRAAVQELCEFHVERLTVPRGWTVNDRRPGSEPDRAVAEGPEVEDSEAPVAEAPVAERAEVPVAEAPEVEGSEVEDPVPEALTPAEAPMAAEAPDDGAPDAPSEGPASSGLLGRAFAWTGPQHSVLTTPAADPESEATPARE